MKQHRARSRWWTGLLVLALTGCIDKEVDQRKVDEAVEDAIAQDTTVRSLAARVDSLERAVAQILEQYSRRTPVAEGTAEDPYADDEPETAERARPDSAARPLPGVRTARAEYPAAVQYATYRNDRLGYTIDYPSNVMTPVEALGHGNGYRFASTDGSAVLAVYAVDGVEATALRDLYREEIDDPDRRITYKTLHEDWFVLSGFAGDQVFYQRTLLRGDVLKTFLLLYDAAAKPYFDPITEHISFSFEG
jgi:hypothetical protein